MLSAALQLQRGFALIELIVVPLIIGVLAALIVPNVLNRPTTPVSQRPKPKSPT